MEKMDNVYFMDHPLIQHKISMLRDKNTGTNEFCKLVEEISVLMGYEPLTVNLVAGGAIIFLSLLAMEVSPGALLRRRLFELEKALETPLPADKAKAAAIARDDILVKTQKLGKACDKLERLLPRSVWPMPTFDDMLYEDIQV